MPSLPKPVHLSFPSSREPFQSKKQDWSSYHLYTLRKSIDDKSVVNNKIREQLKMEKQTSQKLLSQIRTSMISTEQNGIDMVTKVQEQVCKNEYLAKLVKHYQAEIQAQKLQEYENLINKIETNEYDELTKLQKDKQKLLEAVTNRLNASDCQKMFKYEVVKAERRERTVFSNQFNTFENEVFDLEYKYKQFVIERVLLEKIFEDKTQQFQRAQQFWQRKTNKMQQKSKSQKKQKSIHQKDSYNLNIRRTYNEDYSEYIDESLIEPSFYRTRAKLNYMKMQKSQLTSKNNLVENNERKIENLQHLRKIQTVLNDLGFLSIDNLKSSIKESQQIQAKYDVQEKIKEINKKDENMILTLQNQIEEWEKAVQKIKNQKKNKKSPQKIGRSQKLKMKSQKQLKRLIDTLHNQCQEEKSMINEFNKSQNLQSLKKILQISQDPVPNQEDELNETSHSLIDIKMLQKIQTQFFSIMGHLIDFRQRPKLANVRKSIFIQSAVTQSQEKDSSLFMTQKTICPLLQPSRIHNSKRMKTAGSQQLNHQGIKKLSNLLKNQSRLKGPTEIASKDQMIREAIEAFNTEGMTRTENFEVRYS